MMLETELLGKTPLIRGSSRVESERLGVVRRSSHDSRASKRQ